MKKTLLTVLGVLCSATMVAGFAACGGGGDGGNSSTGGTTPTVTYTLSSAQFDKELTYKETFSYSGLTLKGSDGKDISVTAAMVSGATTSSVGNKELTIEYAGETYTVNYSVKYQVEFIVDGNVEKTQYVMSASELTYPADPQKADHAFTGWSVAKGTPITDNTKIVAQFEGVEETADIKIDFGTKVKDGVYEMEYNDIGDISVVVTSTGTNVTWSAELDNDNIVIEEGQDVIDIESLKAGVTTLTVKAENAEGTVVEKSCKIVVKPQDFMINELDLGSDDIEGVRTLGRLDANGSASQTALTLATGKEGSVGKGFNENIKWASDNAKVTVNNGVVTLAEGSGAEMVKLTATFEVNGKVYATSAAYEVRCVFDGVNVATYADLIKATEAGKAVVLNGDIAFPTAKNDIKVYTMHTTYDDTYYVNKYPTSHQTEAQIKVLTQFKNDLYGNGYEINAHNATAGFIDDTGALKADAIFRGPLNFVAMGAGEETGMLSVKAQDNVCFALFEGVTVNNVELRGCDLTADSNGNYDLTDLDYIGTTVEVFGDDVTIEYSRLTNGRTVLRIFGDAENDEKAIHVDIKNSVLSGAREFIIRMGSNRFVKDDNNPSPYLAGDNGAALIAKKRGSGSQYYQNMTKAQKDTYDGKYINTFVNVKNSVFKDAGIFAIGMDSHFAGEALHDPESNGVYAGVLGESAAYWKNVAKTSYGAKLTFEGEVKMYNWKPLDQIDSSTLIENLGPDGWKWDGLVFDVKTMVGNIVQEDDRYKPLLVKYEKKDYVHAGIAFFGGGRNYSVFDEITATGTSDYMGFEVSLDQVGQGMLEVAAGSENFYFILCDASSTFSPQKQAEILASKNAYDCIYKK